MLVLNGDILSGHDLVRPGRRMHEKAAAAVTLHLTQVDDPSRVRLPCRPTPRAGSPRSWRSPRSRSTNQINAGCYVFRRSAIDAIPAGEVVSVERETFPGLIASGAVVHGLRRVGAYWLDVGTPAAFVRGSCDLVLGRLASPAVPAGPGGVLTLDGAGGRPGGAVVRGGTAVGARRGRRGGRDGGVGSVLFDGAVVEQGAAVSRLGARPGRPRRARAR